MSDGAAPVVELVEVSARDGLQNDPAMLTTEQKVELIKRAVDAGARRVEVASFVNPKRVPQMADAEAVMAALADLPVPEGTVFSTLALNERGLDRAIAAGASEVNFAVVTTDTFCEKNQGMTTAESIAAFAVVARKARAAGIRASVVLAASFGCPFEGEVPIARTIEVVKAVADAGPTEISLADTIGAATPFDVRARVEATRAIVGDLPIRAHFHNTRNTGLANIYAAYEAGIRSFDASLGGIGGCPFAPKATGNVPTEDVLFMLQRMGIETGWSLAAAIDTVHWLDGVLGRITPGALGKAGPFPKVA